MLENAATARMSKPESCRSVCRQYAEATSCRSVCRDRQYAEPNLGYVGPRSEGNAADDVHAMQTVCLHHKRLCFLDIISAKKVIQRLVSASATGPTVRRARTGRLRVLGPGEETTRIWASLIWLTLTRASLIRASLIRASLTLILIWPTRAACYRFSAARLQC